MPKVFAGPFRENTTITASPTYPDNETFLVYLLDASSASFDVTLPDPSDFQGTQIDCKRIDNTEANSVRVLPNGAETIDNQDEAVLNPMDSYTLVSDGTNWWVI